MHDLVLQDPELAMVDQRLPEHSGLVVIAAFAPKIPYRYGGLGEVIADRTRWERHVSASVTPDQQMIEPTAHVLVQGRLGGSRYGFVPSPSRLFRMELDHGVPRRRVDSLQRQVVDALKRGWLYGWWITTTAPQGEWRAVHRFQITRQVPAREFDAVRRQVGAPAEIPSRYVVPEGMTLRKRARVTVLDDETPVDVSALDESSEQ